MASAGDRPEDGAPGRDPTEEAPAPLEIESEPPGPDEEEIYIEPAEPPSDPSIDGAERPAEAAEERRPDARAARSEGPRRVIAVASGKGGVGKSLIAASVSIYVAQLGKQVVLVDANLGSGNLHTLVGIEEPEVSIHRFLTKELKQLSDAVVQTSFGGLGLVPGYGDGIGAANPRPAQKNRMLTQIRSLPAEYVVIDVAPGNGFNALDTFLAGDAHVVVIQPEPTSIESAFRLLKNAFLRRVRAFDGFSRLLSDLPQGPPRGLPAPAQLLDLARRRDDQLAEELHDAMTDFRPALVVNMTRTREDLEIGPALATIARRHLGLPVDYIGYVEDEDLVWMSVRKRRSLLVEYPEAKVCKDLERISRRLLARDSLDTTASTELPPSLEQQNHYEILGLHPGATEAELREAQRRARKLYEPGSLAIYGAVSAEEVRSVIERVEEAYTTLIDPEKRRDYNRQLFPDWQSDQPERAPRAAVAKIVAKSAWDDANLPPMDESTEFTGALLKEIREARGLELQDIAEKTKIAISHLRSIEEEIFVNAPARVYLRGFVKAVASALRLDPERVLESYMARYEAASKEE